MEIMKKTTVRNLEVYLKPRIRKSDDQVVPRINILSPILNTIAEYQHTKQNEFHVMKWVDLNGFINIGIQFVASSPLGNENNHINSASLVFAQKETDVISMTLFQTVSRGGKTVNQHTDLGTYSYVALTEQFMLEKIRQFLDIADVFNE